MGANRLWGGMKDTAEIFRFHYDCAESIRRLCLRCASSIRIGVSHRIRGVDSAAGAREEM